MSRERPGSAGTPRAAQALPTGTHLGVGMTSSHGPELQGKEGPHCQFCLPCTALVPGMPVAPGLLPSPRVAPCAQAWAVHLSHTRPHGHPDPSGDPRSSHPHL